MPNIKKAFNNSILMEESEDWTYYIKGSHNSTIGFDKFEAAGDPDIEEEDDPNRDHDMPTLEYCIKKIEERNASLDDIFTSPQLIAYRILNPNNKRLWASPIGIHVATTEILYTDKQKKYLKIRHGFQKESLILNYNEFIETKGDLPFKGYSILIPMENTSDSSFSEMGLNNPRFVAHAGGLEQAKEYLEAIKKNQKRHSVRLYNKEIVGKILKHIAALTGDHIKREEDLEVKMSNVMELSEEEKFGVEMVLTKFFYEEMQPQKSKYEDMALLFIAHDD